MKEMSCTHVRTPMRVLTLVCAIAFAAWLPGCGSSNNSASGTGTLRVAMVDGPDPTITAFTVTITRIEANINGAWSPINLSVQTFDLLNFAHSSLLVGSIGLPAGHYNQLRLFPSSATVTDADGTFNVNIPSGYQTGIKINIDANVAADQVTTVTLDFNIHHSLHKLGNGNYQLQPVITAFLQVANGAISGTIRYNGVAASGTVLTAIYTYGPPYMPGTPVNMSTTLP